MIRFKAIAAYAQKLQSGVSRSTANSPSADSAEGEFFFMKC